MNNICCIGHITLDKIITPKQTSYMPGGTAYYFSYGINNLNDSQNYRLVTALAPSEYPYAEEMKKKGINIKIIPSRRTVYFENSYEADQNNRTQRVLAKADPFTLKDVEDENARFFHLGSLLADDFAPEVIKHLSKKGILSVDAQGYLREVKGDKVFPVDWENKRELLQYVHILKVNEHEAEVLTGLKDYREAAIQLHQWGVKEVLLTLGSLGSLIYAEQKFYRIPAYPPAEIIDATGCGDTYVMGYLYMRDKGASYDEAGCFAAALSTLKIEKSGPFSGTEKQALKIIRESHLHAEEI